MLSLVGLNFSLTIASVTGFFAFVPYVGYLIGISAALGVALSQFQNWNDISLVLGVFLLGQVIESYFLLPKMVGDRIGLHPVWIIFSLLTGGLLMGFTGLLLAMPIAATLGVLLRVLIREYRKSIYYA
jgi:predicted PurR-regulated permease PerM